MGGQRSCRALVFAAGQIADYSALRPYVIGAGLVVAADGGLRHVEALGLRADVLVGDFDSLDEGERQRMVDAGVHVVSLQRDKDLTDTHQAVREALGRGARELVLLGATGDRLDHTLANLLLLPALPDGVSACLVDAKNEISLVSGGGQVNLTAAVGAYVSLLPLSPEVTGIHTTGLRWELSGDRLSWGESRGVSNEFIKGQATVRVEQGKLLVIKARD